MAPASRSPCRLGDHTPDGTFSFNFQDFTAQHQSAGHRHLQCLRHGLVQQPRQRWLDQQQHHRTFQINNTIPAAVNDFRLSPADDTGIVGDNVTNDRTPSSSAPPTPGNTVELFVNGQPAVQAMAIASSTTSTDADGTITSRSSSPTP